MNNEINKMLNIIGTMSGTSMDGINATLAITNGDTLFRTNINLIGNYSKNTFDLLNMASKDYFKLCNKKKNYSMNLSPTIIP